MTIHPLKSTVRSKFISYAAVPPDICLRNQPDKLTGMLRIFITLIAYIIGIVGSADQGGDIENRGFPENNPAMKTYTAELPGNLGGQADQGAYLSIVVNPLEREAPKGEITP